PAPASPLRRGGGGGMVPISPDLRRDLPGGKSSCRRHLRGNGEMGRCEPVVTASTGRRWQVAIRLSGGDLPISPPPSLHPGPARRAAGALPSPVRFETLAAAPGPAREVFVTDRLDDGLDLDTFELTEVAFANQSLAIPAGRDHCEAPLPIKANG